MDIVTIVGARPQFVKAAVVSRCIRGDGYQDIHEHIVHTGQHYDRGMSDVFFDELEIPHPKVNLHVGSGAHGKMTGAMLMAVEDYLVETSPDLVLVYGDTNSTLAGALAAAKLHIPVAHVESGLRSYNRRMPEELNRVLTDHMSTLLFAPTATALSNLKSEGIDEMVYNVGDVMCDATLHYADQLWSSVSAPSFRGRLGLADSFYLLTLHRAENTDNPEVLRRILDSLASADQIQIVFPIHPRTAKAIAEHALSLPANVVRMQPVGYLDMLRLESLSSAIVTDSGGVQKEAYFLHKPCVTVREETEWVETVEAEANVIVGSDTDAIARALNTPPKPQSWPEHYGSGQAGKRILDAILNFHSTTVDRLQWRKF